MCGRQQDFAFILNREPDFTDSLVLLQAVIYVAMACNATANLLVFSAARGLAKSQIASLSRDLEGKSTVMPKL